jgi:hypothetical protein
MEISQLWNCADAKEWQYALDRYWRFVKPENEEVERRMADPDLATIVQAMDEGKWTYFLKDYYH